MTIRHLVFTVAVLGYYFVLNGADFNGQGFEHAQAGIVAAGGGIDHIVVPNEDSIRLAMAGLVH